MKKKLAFLLIALVSILVVTRKAEAQKITISGFVTDSSSGEKLIGAYVFDAKKNIGTSTNNYGFYSLTLPTDTANLTISYVGYRAVNKFILSKQNVSINVPLQQMLTLKTTTISATRNSAPIQERSQMSEISIPIAQIKKVPAMFGETDVLKVLQLLPGVQKGSEGSSGIYVRGGGPDQNLILLDGVPVYNVSHLFGFFSVFNTDALNNVTLIKGGFPAYYGGRLSSVIDISMKEGNMKKLSVSGGVGVIASRLTIEGPIQKDKTSFIISARRTYIDLLMRPASKIISKGAASIGYYFYDLNAKVNHKFGDKDRVYLSSYFGKDVFDVKFGDTYTLSSQTFTSNNKAKLWWGNGTAAARWNHLFTPKLFHNATATYSQYQFSIGANAENKLTDAANSANNTTSKFGIEYLSRIQDVGFRSDFDYSPVSKHHIKFGANGIYHMFSPGIQSFSAAVDGTTLSDTSISEQKFYCTELATYLQDDWELSRRLKANVGVHASGFIVQNVFYKSLQPRLSMRYLLNPELSIKASYAQMAQYLHLLSNSGINLPTDLWLPVTAKVKPQTSEQYALGAAYTLKDDYEFSLEGYYKNMYNVLEYKNGANFISSGDWQDKVTNGKAWSYGAELFVQRKTGRFTGWLGYTLSWTYRQFADKNNGDPYFYKYDRRHDVGLVMAYKINDKWDVAATWVYGTGNAISVPLQKYLDYTVLDYRNLPYLSGAQIENFDKVNNFRMPSYHRADFAINRTNHTKKGKEFVHNISIYNLYNHLNAFFLYSGYKKNDPTQPTYKKLTLFPIIPAYSLNFKF